MKRRSLLALCLAALTSTLLAPPVMAAPTLTVGLIPAEDSQAMLENSKLVINGFVKTDDHAYDVVRETDKILTLDLKAMK